MKKKKNIEIIIHEMIDIVLEQGHKPFWIYLTDEDYDELAERTGHFRSEGYEIIDDGIVYNKNKIPLRIESYMGIPVYHGSETRIKWQ